MGKNHKWLLVTIICMFLLLGGCGEKTTQPSSSGDRHSTQKVSTDHRAPAASDQTTQAVSVTREVTADSAAAAKNGSTSASNSDKATSSSPAGKSQPAPATPRKNSPPPVAPTASTVPAQVVTVSVTGDQGTIMKAQKIPIKGEISAFAATKQATDQAGIKLEYQGMGTLVYVSGIGGLREFDRGPMSGWLYKVNGVTPDRGCGDYTLKPGDRLEWVYTTTGK